MVNNIDAAKIIKANKNHTHHFHWVQKVTAVVPTFFLSYPQAHSVHEPVEEVYFLSLQYNEFGLHCESSQWEAAGQWHALPDKVLGQAHEVGTVAAALILITHAKHIATNYESLNVFILLL